MKLNGLQRFMMERAQRGTAAAETEGWDAGTLNVDGKPIRLHVGSLSAALDTQALMDRHITHVLTVACGLKAEQPGHINHLTLSIPDHPNADLFQVLPAACQFIDLAMENPEGGVLVHCASGISRSVSVCCAWLMSRKNMTFVDAVALVREYRPHANPNCGFQMQLRALDAAANDIPSASKRYTESLGGYEITAFMLKHRDASNAFHERADDLELDIKQECLSSSSKEEKSVKLRTWQSQLTDLISEMDEYNRNANNEALSIEDKPAKLIRKSAYEKCVRLLDDVHALLST